MSTITFKYWDGEKTMLLEIEGVGDVSGVLFKVFPQGTQMREKIGSVIGDELLYEGSANFYFDESRPKIFLKDHAAALAEHLRRVAPTSILVQVQP